MQELDASLATFVPADRRDAIRAGTSLGPLVTGTALFADLSGFTPLTQRLMEAQGADRGGESLARHLAQMFDVLVRATHENGGSVISFAGDAITCWFDGDDGQRAVRCGLRMQAELPAVGRVPIAADETITVSLKVAAASGNAIRGVVGSPDIQLIDVLAGASVDLMAEGESLASPGEVLVDEGIAGRLGDGYSVAEWRQQNGSRFGVVSVRPHVDLTDTADRIVETTPLSDPAGNWLLPAIHERFKVESTSFIGGFRTIVVLFLQFGDLDFENDPEVLDKLAGFTRWVQEVVTRYDGALVGLTLGDKGSYLQVSFGGVHRHEDDVERALSAALELRTPVEAVWGVDRVTMGITQGLCYVGPYGSSARRTFGSLGHIVNLSARLMGRAQQGQILMAEDLATGTHFRAESAGVAELKGVTEPVALFALAGRRDDEAGMLNSAPVEEPSNRAEWPDLVRFADQVKAGGQACVLLDGPAGIGKSHLMAALQRAVDERNFETLTGTAAAVGGGSPYQALRSGLRRLLGLGQSSDAVQGGLEALLARVGSEATERAALLNAVVGTSFEESDIVRGMEGQVRADNTIQLVRNLVDLARGTRPLFLGIEDAHLLDSASWALVRELRTLNQTYVAIAARSVDHTVDRTEWDELVASPGTHHLDLGPLPASAVTGLVARRLGVAELPAPLAELIIGKAAGNPLFAEELAYSLRDAGRIRIDDGTCHIVGDPASLQQAALSNTIEGVVLGRIDQLPGPLQLSVRVASVIGEIFGFDLLHEVHPVSDARESRKGQLDDLDRFDITSLAATDPLLEYVFRHAITRDVAYGSMTFGQRQQLHQLIGSWYEDRHGDALTEYAAVLAHHWTHAAHRENAVRYLDLAATEALKSNANREAAESLREAMRIAEDPDVVLWGTPPLVVDSEVKARRHHELGEALYRLGDLEGANRSFAEGLRHLGHEIPESDGRKVASILRHVGGQIRRRGRPPVALQGVGSGPADALAVAIHERMLEASFMQNDSLGTAYSTLQSLIGAERLGPSPALADAHSKMCMACGMVPLHRAAEAYERQSRQQLLDIDDPVDRGNILMSLSMYRAGVGDTAGTGLLLDEALECFTRIGNRERQRICLELLRLQAWFAGDFARHWSVLDELQELALRDADELYHSLALTAKASHLLLATTDGHPTLALADQTEFLGDELVVESKIATQRAAAHLRLGNTDEAFQFSQESSRVVADLPPTSFGLLQVYAMSATSALDLLELRGSDDPAAVTNAKRACKSLSGYARVYPIGRAPKLMARARLRVLTGKPARAEGMLRDAVSSAARLNMYMYLPMAQYELAKVLPPGAERTRFLEAARRRLTEQGAGYYLSLVQMELDQ